MVTQKVLISNPTGLHARPAHKFVSFLKDFKSEVLLHVNDTEVNCGSIINLLLAAIKQGTTVEVQVRGEDEAEALPKIVEFLENLAE